MKTIRELSTELQERSLTMQIHGAGERIPNWVVLVYAADDPSCFFSAENDDLCEAVIAAIAAWDNCEGRKLIQRKCRR